MPELIVALDVPGLAEEERLLERLKGTVRFFKIGLELFTLHGAKAVELAQRFDAKLFLDLKLYDIPRTVASAVRQAKALGVHSVSLHLSGGPSMIEAAAAVSPRPLLWGVTVLTSLSEEEFGSIFPKEKIAPSVARLAKLGQTHGADGIVCSPREAAALRKKLGSKVALITPGIRSEKDPPDDQRRTMTPGEAAAAGVSFIVVGRPITQAAEPAEAARMILNQLNARRLSARG